MNRQMRKPAAILFDAGMFRRAFTLAMIAAALLVTAVLLGPALSRATLPSVQFTGASLAVRFSLPT